MSDSIGVSPSPPWRTVPIRESGEPLVRLHAGPRLGVRPIYRLLGHAGAVEHVYLRAGVIDRLRTAAARLPEGLTLCVWDGWRPHELQSQLYTDYTAALAETSKLTGRDLDELVQRFVSVPSLEPECPSPHLTGGSVDLTLADESGEPLDMGGEFDELTDRSRTDFYDDSDVVLSERREILRSTLSEAGFTNFESEWWHFDFGNQLWAFAQGEVAIYGKCEPPQDS